MPRVLVYQANGVQGAATARFVRQAGYITRVLIRDSSKQEAFTSQGMEVAAADFQDRNALLRAHESVDYVVLQIPAYTDAFVAKAIESAAFAMESKAIKGVIVKMANPTPVRVAPDSGFSANAIVLERMRASKIPFSVVEPTMYLDTFLKPNLRREVSRECLIDLPVAETLKVAWTTVDDAARMAVLLLQAGTCGMTLRCAGEVAYDGHELAAVFSSVLGKAIRYRSIPVEVFQREIESAIGLGAAAPAVSKFRFLSSFPEEAIDMFSRTFRADGVLGGFSPTTVRDWISSNGAAFGQQAAQAHTGSLAVKSSQDTA